MALDPPRAGLVDEQVGERVRQVARQRDQAVVGLRVDRDRHGAERGDEAVHEPVALGVGRRPPASGTRSRRRRGRRSRAPGRAPRGRRPDGRRRTAPGAAPTSPSSSRRPSRSRAPARPRARPRPATASMRDRARRRREVGLREHAPSSRPASSTAPRSSATPQRLVGVVAGDAVRRRPASRPGRRTRPSGPCRRLQGASAAGRAHQLGDLEREVERLACVQARVAERRVRGRRAAPRRGCRCRRDTR